MPIIIDIAPLLKNVGKIIAIDETESVSYPDDNLMLTAPIHVSGELINTGSTILLKGNVKTVVKLNCCRCLKDFDSPISFMIEEEYGRNPVKIKGKADVQLKEKDFVFEIEADNTINLSEAVRQNLITEIPIQPLCDKDCKGG